MAGRTNTERIEDLSKQVVILTRDVEHLRAILRDHTEAIRLEQSENRHRVQVLQSQVDELIQRTNHLERFEPSQIPVLVQRLGHLEKLLDEGRTRRWQV